MNNLVLACCVLLINIAANSQSNYYKGFDVGFKEGFCYLEIGCIAPNPPIPPIPGVSEDINSYKDGYNKGFQMGYSAHQSSNSNKINLSNGNDYSNNERQQFQIIAPANIDYMSNPDINNSNTLHVRSSPNSTSTYTATGKSTKGKSEINIPKDNEIKSDFNISEVVLNYSTMNSLMSKINFYFNQNGDKKISKDGNFVTVTYKNESKVTSLVTYTYNGEIEQIVFLMPVDDSKEIVDRLVQIFGTNIIDGKHVIKRNELTYDLHIKEQVGMILIY